MLLTAPHVSNRASNAEILGGSFRPVDDWKDTDLEATKGVSDQ
jgi:hypothetical protein